MIIKKYQAKTEAEAIEEAKKELGNSVVIMNTKNVKRRGLFAIFKPHLIEITAAVEEETEKKKDTERDALPKNPPAKEDDATAKALEVIKSVAAIQSKAGDPLKKEKPAGKDTESSLPEKEMSPLEHYQEAIKKTGEINTRSLLFTQEEEKQAKLREEKMKNESQEAKVLEQKLETLQNLIESQIKKNDDSDEETEEKKEEENQKEKEMKMFLKLLYNTMIDNEVDEKYANQIIDEMDKTTKNNLPIDYILANVYQKMILKFGRPIGITPAEKKPKVVFFIGPTGVGKTTTIAKIASKFHVDENKKIALLTADTYRIAAADQLQTYANIMDVPCRVIYSTDEVVEAYHDYEDCDYILVDTAGHSHHNDVQKANMNNFIHSLDGIAETEVFLVVSATTKYRDLLSIADAYCNMTDLKIIFTKLDETTTLGNLLNLKLYTGASLSYVTCGQNVPEDIENFNPQATVKQLLRIKKQSSNHTPQNV